MAWYDIKCRKCGRVFCENLTGKQWQINARLSNLDICPSCYADNKIMNKELTKVLRRMLKKMDKNQAPGSYYSFWNPRKRIYFNNCRGRTGFWFSLINNEGKGVYENIYNYEKDIEKARKIWKKQKLL